jgi:alginate O-acetyltransferase complex protein AlgI
VWFLTGFWHGASWNFALWGLFFCVFLCLEKAFLLSCLERSRVLSRLYLLFLVLISWALFAVTDFNELGTLLGRLFVPSGGDDWVYYLRNYGVSLGLGVALSTPLLKKLSQRVPNAAVTVFCLTVLVACVAYLVDSTYNPFLYFRF